MNSDHPYSKLLTEEPEKQEKSPPELEEEQEKELQIVKFKRQMSRTVSNILICISLLFRTELVIIR